MDYCKNCEESSLRKTVPNRAKPAHECVFKLELYNDHEKCTCCDACADDCAMEV